MHGSDNRPVNQQDDAPAYRDTPEVRDSATVSRIPGNAVYGNDANDSSDREARASDAYEVSDELEYSG